MTKNQRSELRYHIVFWLIYILLWGARDLIYSPHLIGNIVVNGILCLVVAPFIYLNNYVLIPKFLFKKRWILYCLTFLIGFFVVFFTRHFTFQFIFRDLLKEIELADKFVQPSGYVVTVSENVILITITTAMVMFREWYGKEKYARELEQKNAMSELSLLKSQLQPHFLFNNLNTIYFLMESNPTLAKEVMLQFSDVLSHQLYNAKKDKVLLTEELQSLESFLQIQKIRHEDFLTLTYHFPEDTENLQIAPMMMLTFIENAFKHSQKEEGYFIEIGVSLNGNKLQLLVKNSIGFVIENEKSGVGLQNARRRLELIYPDQHELSIESTDETYSVDLTLNLESYEPA